MNNFSFVYKQASQYKMQCDEIKINKKKTLKKYKMQCDDININ